MSKRRQNSLSQKEQVEETNDDNGTSTQVSKMSKRQTYFCSLAKSYVASLVLLSIAVMIYWRVSVNTDRKIDEMVESLLHNASKMIDELYQINKVLDNAKQRIAKMKEDNFFMHFKNDEGNESMSFIDRIVKKEYEKHVGDGINRVYYDLSYMTLPGILPGFHWYARLNKPIILGAITLEHEKCLGPERMDAPYHCRLYGWLQWDEVDTASGQQIKVKNRVLLAEFVYDIEGSKVQTFKTLDRAGSHLYTVDHVKLEILSNRGNTPSGICLYRWVLHGYGPDYLSTLINRTSKPRGKRV